MNNGIQLTLMIGPVVAVPVPKAVLDALTSVKVTTTARQASVFELTFDLSNRSPLHTLLLLSAGESAVVRVIIVVTVNGMPDVLIDGVMTKHQIQPGREVGQSTLMVTGQDLIRVMDHFDFSGLPYPAMPPEAQVAFVLSKYAVLGIVPAVVPSVLSDVPIPTERIPRQQGTDLDHILTLAEEGGYVFYLEPGPAPGMSIAYWGPEIRVGVPQPALNLDMDAHTNVESLDFRFDSDSSTLPVMYIQDQASKFPIPIPVPDISLLSPPLGLVPPLRKGIEPIEGTAKLSPIRAALIGLARAGKGADAVTGSGTLDVLRYGRVLKARRLVGVRGAGLAFDGLHYVTSVTHNIKPGEYKQSFELSRNGLISTLPRVPA